MVSLGPKIIKFCEVKTENGGCLRVGMYVWLTKFSSISLAFCNFTNSQAAAYAFNHPFVPFIIRYATKHTSNHHLSISLCQSMLFFSPLLVT